MGHPLGRLLGADTRVDCLDGHARRYADLDSAASTPVLEQAWRAVEAFLPCYSSVHRGSGFKSQVATEAYERARGAVGRFVGSGPDHAVRHGCFCAHPLITHLLGVDEPEIARLHAELRAGARPLLPGAVRASVGLGSTVEDVDRLAEALHAIRRAGPSAAYAHDAAADEYQPRFARAAAAAAG